MSQTTVFQEGRPIIVQPPIRLDEGPHAVAVVAHFAGDYLSMHFDGPAAVVRFAKDLLYRVEPLAAELTAEKRRAGERPQPAGAPE